jgi:hypothetical protein
MPNFLPKLAVATMGIAISLVAIEPIPVEAAVFNFSFNYNSQNFGSGSLSFNDASLTGKGEEKIKLSQLLGSSFQFLFAGGTINDPLFGLSPSRTEAGLDPTFTFNNGSLTGLSFAAVSPPIFKVANPDASKPLQIPLAAVYSFGVQESNWLDLAIAYRINPTTMILQPIRTLSKGGRVNIQTVVPFQKFPPPPQTTPVPEPASIAALSALSLVFFVKKKRLCSV